MSNLEIMFIREVRKQGKSSGQKLNKNELLELARIRSELVKSLRVKGKGRQ